MARKTRASASPKTPSKTSKSVSADSTPVKSPAAAKTKKALKAEAKSLKQKEYGYVSKLQATQAIDELKKYISRSKEEAKEKSTKADLFEDEDQSEENSDLVLKFQLKEPKLISLAKPYKNIHGNIRTCLFLRDQFITSEEEVEKIEAAQIPTLAKILTLTQLKTIYKPFEKRRELLNEYDMFVVDDAILSSMPSTLGKTFYQTRKFPVHVRVASTKSPKELSHQTLTNQINKVLASTAFLPPAVLKHFDQKQLVTVGLQAADSPVLPLYYADKIYEDSDVLENVVDKDAAEESDSEDVYTKALLELADENTVKQVLGKKMNAHKKKHPKAKTAKSEGKVSKA
ncbi:hypothetical protein HF325_001746 [Metschnikowia pulcherrima]|uniref:Uncharacterized protein n=1 Tax=Metschnikowia pulcherrima TaxID=27326 RepID=A0A8H7GYY6_9ASCO|nr:hypothetical protein HF325_001746 [Metschnikowia pulcherrima]